MPSIQRWFVPLCALLLAGMAVVQISSIREESQTFDEAIHVSAGYSYWKTGDFRMNPEHPPLGKLLNALPLLAMGLEVPTWRQSWIERLQLPFGAHFLYHNRAPADVILFRARLVTIMITLALGAALAWWTRRRFGVSAALLALAFFVFDPNIIAHGRYVTSDVLFSLFSFLTCVFAAEYLLTGKHRFLVLTGVSLGLALATKFSAIYLFLALPVLWCIHHYKTRKSNFRQGLREAGVVIGLATAIVIVVYTPDWIRLLPKAANGDAPRLAEKIPSTTAPARLARSVSQALDLPELALPLGVGRLIKHNQLGHTSYLRGALYEKGCWYYFPIAFAVKAPTALLLALLLAGVILWRYAPRPLPLEYWAMLVPGAVYLAIAMSSNLNLGIRHLLPAFPPLFVLVAAGLVNLSWAGRRVVIGGLMTLLAVESLAIYPHYLAFFNWPSGGPSKGRFWLVDSNLDWGQDLKRLKRYLDSHGIQEVALHYFGTAPTDYYGIRSVPAPRTSEVGNPPRFDGVVAVSVTALHGITVPPEDFAWLRDREPAARIGYSIHIYDFRKNKDSRQATKWGQSRIGRKVTFTRLPITVNTATSEISAACSSTINNTAAVQAS